jgi:hypothetical protein
MTDNTPRPSEHSEPMSTTDKLAQALRDMTKHCVSLLRSGRDSILQAGGECDTVEVMERGDPYLAKARETLAEYDATPAGEVTADAVQIALDSWYGLDGGLHGGADSEERQRMQAALAAAYPALVQQVERLHEDKAGLCEVQRDLHAKIATLSAANARLAKDAERLDFLDAKRAAFIGGYGLSCQSFRDDVDKEMRDTAQATEKTK